MFTALCRGVRRLGQRLLHTVHRRLLAATVPSVSRLAVDTLAHLPRSKGELIAENGLLRQQLLVLRRSVTLVLLASWVRTWHHALLIIQPDCAGR